MTKGLALQIGLLVRVVPELEVEGLVVHPVRLADRVPQSPRTHARSHRFGSVQSNVSKGNNERCNVSKVNQM